MKRQYTFDCSHHVDLIFRHNGVAHNFGYNYNMAPFASLWLYHKQVTGKNIFERTRIRSGESISLDLRLEDTVNGAIEFSRALPSTIEEFNMQLKILRLVGFAPGNSNTTIYRWALKEDGLFHLDVKTEINPALNGEIFHLSPETDSVFLKDYLAFLKSCPHMGGCYDWSCEVIRRLK